MQIRTLSNYLHIQWKDRKFSKELNYIEVQWKMNLNLCESSVKTGPVLKTYSSLKDSTCIRGDVLIFPTLADILILTEVMFSY